MTNKEIANIAVEAAKIRKDYPLFEFIEKVKEVLRHGRNKTIYRRT